jgi:hypothetical protein
MENDRQGNDRQGSTTIGNDRQKSEVSETYPDKPLDIVADIAFPCRSLWILVDRLFLPIVT